MILHHLLSITFALIIDRLIGDPPTWPHPVKMIGSLILRLERFLNKGKHRKAKGTVLLVLILVSVFLVTWGIVLAAYQIHSILGIVVEAMLIATTIAQKGLKEAALGVYQPLKDGDMEKAKQRVSMIVGRDTANLDESEITRATVETVAENCSDGITAPLFWACIGGAPLAMAYRAVNTCDSMVGYKNEQYLYFGWASARFDDVVNWIPSRLTGFCMMMANRSAVLSKGQALSQLRQEAKKHPSPNSGWGEAAAAILLGVQLGGVNYYKGIKSERERMGQAIHQLQKEHIIQTNRIMAHTVWLFFILLWIGGGSIALTSTWS
ncbi:adenosylcobinamide-phosphate synthase CbiB [Virgibacillus halodenitrificans]|uniref:adenosylcobinamide-phosphate synthase CbiB n=1 Tax=Virgibacillus halodenitrificans TaxID=1482 RepID=UPI001FB43BAD|nr:adenosylcobinamide-phosphate synthase CbiB [Virgibacillus halodenitrificans]MCJ0930451.1 adenosylcobinamide-phosphate synthase CbiB [Virgibacillus halodenitrificans]